MKPERRNDISAKTRRSQAERSADTRKRVLSAAVRCLHKYGYTGTTTPLVAKAAGISRGAMLHQFPTKTDLMLFVVRQVFDQGVERFNARLRKGRPPESDMIQMVWEANLSPEGIATLEIMLAARSDKVLATRLIPIHAEIERDSLRVAAAMYSDGVHADGGDVGSLVGLRLINWAMRGLAVCDLVTRRGNQSRELAQLFQKLLLDFVERMKRAMLERAAGSPAAQAESGRAPAGRRSGNKDGTASAQ